MPSGVCTIMTDAATIEMLRIQIENTKTALLPEAEVYGGLCEVTLLIEMFFKYMETIVDKKMHQVTERMKTAGKDIAKGKTKQAEAVLKGAEKKNEKLVKIDREVRDPLIDKCKKDMKMKGK